MSAKVKKNTIIAGNSPETLTRIFEANIPGNAKNKKYKFTGCFTQCSSNKEGGKIIMNRNKRIYFDDEVLRHLGYLRDQIKENGFLPGELDHPDRFEVKLSEASHKITDLWYEPETQRVMGTLELIDTPNGNIAKTLVDEGLKLAVSSRSAGTVRPDSSVELEMMYTWDIVLTPGFEEAHLQRVMEHLGTDSKASKFLNESLKNIDNDIIEVNKEIKITEARAKALKKEIDMDELTQHINHKNKLNESEEENIEKPAEKDDENGLPEANINPLAEDEPSQKEDENKDENAESKSEDKDEKSDDENSSEDKEEKPELTDDEKQERRKLIISIESKELGSEDDATDSEKEENRDKIVDMEAIEDTETKEESSDDEESKDDKEEKSDDAEDTNESEDAVDGEQTSECGATENDNDDDPTSIKTKDKSEKAKEFDKKSLNDCDQQCDELKQKTKDDMKKVDDLLAKAKERKSIKEAIIKRYPFAAYLTETNFGSFAALSIKDKDTVNNFILANEIFDQKSINENWKTPLLVEQRYLKNWLRLASDENKKLFAQQPHEIQESIEAQARVVPMFNQADVDAFWDRIGLNRIHAQRVLAESLNNRYSIQSKNVAKDVTLNAEVSKELGYSTNVFQYLEDNYD